MTRAEEAKSVFFLGGGIEDGTERKQLGNHKQ